MLSFSLKKKAVANCTIIFGKDSNSQYIKFIFIIAYNNI